MIGDGAINLVIRDPVAQDRAAMVVIGLLYAYLAFVILRTRRRSRERKALIARHQLETAQS